MTQLIIRDLTLPDGQPGDLWIDQGRIARIGPGLPRPDGAPELDARGWLVFPGAIDMHVHFRTPGAEHKETLHSGALAAAKGGTTTCGDMPNTSPRTTTLATLEQKAALARGAAVNLLFNFGAEPDNLDQVRAAAEHPAVRALKVYMGPSTGQGGLAPQHVEAHFRQAAELDLPVMVHAEDLEQIEQNRSRYEAQVRNHHLLRSAEGELKAVAQALKWAKRYGVRLYLAHCTQSGAIDLAERSGMRERVFVEVCPHHLLLAVEDIAGPAENRYKVNPPLRPEAQRRALFERLALPVGQGGFDGLGSDHAPHTLAEKEAPYSGAPSGIPGVEHLFPLALSWWREGLIVREQLVALTSGNAARYFGLNRGALEAGCEADLVLVDAGAAWRIGEDGDRVVSKCGWSLYGGRVMSGRVMATIVAGRAVYQYSAP